MTAYLSGRIKRESALSWLFEGSVLTLLQSLCPVFSPHLNARPYGDRRALGEDGSGSQNTSVTL